MTEISLSLGLSPNIDSIKPMSRNQRCCSAAWLCKNHVFSLLPVPTNTHLLSTLAGRDHRESGHIEVKGPDNMAKAHKCVAFVERDDLFLPTLSVDETLQVS